MKKAPILFLDPRLHLELFKMMFDQHTEGVVVTDAEGVILYYNRSMGRIDDMNPDMTLGRTINDVYNISPSDSPTMVSLKTKKPVVDCIQYYFTRLGKLVNARCSIYPLIDGDQFLGTLGFTVDYAVENATLNSLMKKTSKPLQPASKKSRAQETVISFDTLVGRSLKFLDAVETAKMASPSSSSVMIVGETGTGKELIAQSIHAASPRRNCPFTAINCAAIPENLLEGLLFGTVKGSFTGATDRAGLFEVCYGGTLFLDELNSMPIGLQSKLLRAVQERLVRRVGALEEIPINVRLISSVSRNPEVEMNAGNLRPDLVYRLGVIKVFLPPLRERIDDLPLLISHFLQKHNRYLGRNVVDISPEAEERFKQYHWPGNIRELEHTIEAGLHFVDKDFSLQLRHFVKVNPVWNAPAAEPKVERTPVKKDKISLSRAREDAEEAVIIKALTSTGGQAAQAARLLGLSPQLFHHKLKKYSIKPADFKPTSLDLNDG
ncbi:transcriptional regulator [Deltaproteobacteria bacterium Smac51]|nr:transcriptional regulator [Deltaproteobacteria bacterium Smac51]